MMAPKCIWILFTLIASVYGQQCTEGQETRRGNAYYVCRSGFQVPVACSTVDGIRVELNANYQTSTFLFTCQQQNPQTYNLIPTACIRHGQVVNLGSTAADQNFWHTCMREGENILMKISGCVGEHGDRVGPNGIVVRSSFLFRCSFQGNNVALEPYGCIVDGSHYPAGPAIISQNFWYQCNVLPGGGGMELKLSGCVENGQKLGNGSTVVKGSFIFRCDISANQARFAAVGCLDDSGSHHMIGDQFREGSGPVVYVFECKREQNKIFKQIRQCYYQGADGQGPVDPNCFVRFGNTLVKCVQRDGGRISAELNYNANDETVRQATNAGFRRC